MFAIRFLFVLIGESTRGAVAYSLILSFTLFLSSTFLSAPCSASNRNRLTTTTTTVLVLPASGCTTTTITIKKSTARRVLGRALIRLESSVTSWPADEPHRPNRSRGRPLKVLRTAPSATLSLSTPLHYNTSLHHTHTHTHLHHRSPSFRQAVLRRFNSSVVQSNRIKSIAIKLNILLSFASNCDHLNYRCILRPPPSLSCLALPIC